MVKRRSKDIKIITKKIKVELNGTEKGDVNDIPDIEAANVFHRIKSDDLDDGVTYPPNWLAIYNGIVDMRRQFTAPVDTMGCERIPTKITPNIDRDDSQTYRFQLLISLMLSSQTKDEVNFDAMQQLNDGLKARGFKGVTLPGILALDDRQLDGYIGKVGFHNRKTGYIKLACKMLQDEFNGDIPTTIDDVVKLPGVGPKMGYLLLQKGWGINDGIGVDVHVHRLAMMWRWSKPRGNPEVTRQELQRWLPKSAWMEINPLLVGFGQVICTPTVKNCDICTINDVCNAANRTMVQQSKAGLTDQRVAKLRASRGDLTQLLP